MNLIIIIFFIILYFLHNKAEYFTSAVLTQLYSKGPTDHYLTSNTDRYIPEFIGSPYRYLPYNTYPPIKYFPFRSNNKYNLGF